jgi:hypothetical protein
MNNMSVQERRDKLAEQFQLMIQDEQKINQLEAMFSGMLDNSSALSEEQWLEVEKRDADFKAGKTKGYTWEEVKQEARLRNGV